MTGTRGKSTVTRLIAAALEEAGLSVLTKTTGSKPALLLPDGREEEVRRRGHPTILEQKRILKRAARLGVDAVVIEMMSIQPECARVESCRLVEPHLLVVTNVRLDHRPEQGWSKPAIARSLASSIPPRTHVFLLEEEQRPEFEAAAAKVRARIVVVGRGHQGRAVEPEEKRWPGFEENIRLAGAVADFLGLPREVAGRGIRRAKPDFGSLKAWLVEYGNPPVPWILVSAFAANEPESTAAILACLKEKLPATSSARVGVLNFRADRGDRTLQWLKACRDGFLDDLDRLYIVGSHVHSLKVRKLARQNRKVIPLAFVSPQEVMARIVADDPDGATLVGMGNMGGLGEEFVNLWAEEGTPYAF